MEEIKLQPISPSKTQEPSASHALIREWLFRFGVEHKEDVAPRLPLWLEQLGGIEPETLRRLFERAMRTYKFFPKVAEILEPLQGAEKKAAPEAAEEAWQHVLDIRRTRWSADVFGGFYGGTPTLSERIWQACRASGVFRDFDSLEGLHTWAHKRFVESFIAYGENEQNAFLPDGEIKNLLTGCAETKALPESRETFEEMRDRGLRYADKLKSDPAQQPDLKRAIRAVAGELAPRPPMRSLDEQKQILRQRGLLK